MRAQRISGTYSAWYEVNLVPTMYHADQWHPPYTYLRAQSPQTRMQRTRRALTFASPSHGQQEAAQPAARKGNSSTQARRWVWTYNNFSASFAADALPKAPFETPTIKFQVYQWERVTTDHLQGFTVFSGPIRLNKLKEWLPGAHFEPALGSDDQCIAYCTKEESRISGPWYIGSRGSVGQGKRTDLKDAVEALDGGADLRSLARTHPTAVIKYKRGLEDLIELRKPKVQDTAFDPRPWQAYMLGIIKEPADDRSIYWIHDTVGGKGKSRLASHLAKDHNALLLEGRLTDMAYLYVNAGCPRIAIFDISRAAAEHSDHLYSFAEKLKNGHMTSTKYTCKHETFAAPHVIFFANFEPDMTKWSRDRYKIINLDTFVPPAPRPTLQRQDAMTQEEIDRLLDEAGAFAFA